jgi:lipopolysaccharide/colanic/teichoic acid biosynthesis glycosyltransferase
MRLDVHRLVVETQWMNGPSFPLPAAGSLPSQDVNRMDFQGSAAAFPTGIGLAPARAGALSVPVYEAVKRGLDLLVCGAALLVLSPFLALIALAIKLQDGGPVLFVQTRVGKGGRPFRFYKFRSMVRDADRLKKQLMELNQHEDQRTFKMKRDPRITPVGRILRRASLDELPQLWNIVKGDMTLVGPRPALPAEVALYTPEDHRRLEVTPGLTCLWQIRGRSELPFEEQVKLDVEYIQTRSVLRDLEILAMTLPAVIGGRGAY